MQFLLKYITLTVLFLVSVYGVDKPKLLPAEEAFRVTSAYQGDGVTIAFTLAEGVYLYDDKIKFELLTPKKLDITSKIVKPTPEAYHEYQTQRRSFTVVIPTTLLKEQGIKKAFSLNVSYLGCSELGICYQPQHKEFALEMKQLMSEQNQIHMMFLEENLAMILVTFFGFGLLLSLTPCIFPMVPILSSIIVSQQGIGMNAKRGFLLSLVYVLSMSLAYTLAGIVAALFGANLQASMQNPYVISTFSLIFVSLALSMFGLYEIKMPSFIQNLINKKTSEAQTHGGMVGIAIMGFLSALIVGPCVAAPLAGALIYIGQSGDALLGGSALFVMSLGMGVPLLVIGTTAGKYLPRPGMWMQMVNLIFGMMLLGIALWMLSRIIPATVSMGLWAVFVICCSVVLGALDTLSPETRKRRKLLKSFLFIGFVYGVLLLVGCVSGATNPFSPLERLVSKEVSTQTSKLAINKVQSLKTLQERLKTASKPVMVDFYADWCANCVEYDQYTFSDPRVQEALKAFESIKLDVTQGSDEDKALQKAFDIPGPPAILFFKDGKELVEYRLFGYKNADEFLAHISRLGL